jgi:hypothetical protein
MKTNDSATVKTAQSLDISGSITVQIGHSGGLSHVALISVRQRGESRERIPNILAKYKLAVYRICTASLERALNIVNWNRPLE